MSQQIYKEKRKRKLKHGAYKGSKKGRRTIRIPIDFEDYKRAITSPSEFRSMISEYYSKYPELFPLEISDSYTLHGQEYSKKLDFTFQRIQVRSGLTYSVLVV